MTPETTAIVGGLFILVSLHHRRKLDALALIMLVIGLGLFLYGTVGASNALVSQTTTFLLPTQ